MGAPALVLKINAGKPYMRTHICKQRFQKVFFLLFSVKPFVVFGFVLSFCYHQLFFHTPGTSLLSRGLDKPELHKTSDALPYPTILAATALSLKNEGSAMHTFIY